MAHQGARGGVREAGGANGTPESSRAAARPMRGVEDAYVASRRPRPNPTRREGEEDAAEQMGPTASSGAVCIDGGHDNGERRRGLHSVLGLGFGAREREAGGSGPSYPPRGALQQR